MLKFESGLAQIEKDMNQRYVFLFIKEKEKIDKEKERDNADRWR